MVSGFVLPKCLIYFCPLALPSAMFTLSKSDSPCDSKKTSGSSQSHWCLLIHTWPEKKKKKDYALGVAKYLVSRRLEKLGSQAYS